MFGNTHIGDYTTQLYGDYFISHEIRISFLPISIMECHKGFESCSLVQISVLTFSRSCGKIYDDCCRKVTLFCFFAGDVDTMWTSACSGEVRHLLSGGRSKFAKGIHLSFGDMNPYKMN